MTSEEQHTARARALKAHRPHGGMVPDHIALSIGDVRDAHHEWWTVVRRDEAETRQMVEANGLTATYTPTMPGCTRVTITLPDVVNRLEFHEVIRRFQSPADVRLHDARRWRPADAAGYV